MPWHLTLSPVRTSRPIAYAVEGDVLIVDGVPFDLTPLPEGASLPRAALGEGGDPPDWLLSPIERRGGALHLTILVGLGPDAGEAARHPVPVGMLRDGPVPLPPAGYPAPVVEPEPEPPEPEPPEPEPPEPEPPGPAALGEPATTATTIEGALP